MTKDNVVRIQKKPMFANMPPVDGQAFSVYAFQNRPKTDDGGFVTVPRHKRQRGKIQEAQSFRRAQGAYLKSRMHFFHVAASSESQLKWWFANTHRIRIHHHLMVNYYLEDRPTPVEELIKEKYCSIRHLHSDLKHASDLGSIEIDHIEKDKRQRVIYPTRGFVADTDSLFGREAQLDNELDGMFVFWSKQLKKYVDEKKYYSLTEYHQDFAAYRSLVADYLPDTDRQF
jgi:hypothetical protein